LTYSDIFWYTLIFSDIFWYILIFWYRSPWPKYVQFTFYCKSQSQLLLCFTWERLGNSHNSRLTFFCPIEGVLIGLNYLIRLWLSQSNTMHQQTYFLITSSELVELSLAQFDYMHCAESDAITNEWIRTLAPWCYVSMQPAL
jgi:hypothetical protein